MINSGAARKSNDARLLDKSTPERVPLQSKSNPSLPGSFFPSKESSVVPQARKAREADRKGGFFWTDDYCSWARRH